MTKLIRDSASPPMDIFTELSGKYELSIFKSEPSHSSYPLIVPDMVSENLDKNDWLKYLVRDN